MFEWLKAGVLKKNYETDRIRLLIAKIKLDDSELNWIYIQMVDQICSDDLKLLRKAFGMRADATWMEISREILAYKKRSKKNG